MPQSTNLKDLRYANKYLFLFSLEATEAKSGDARGLNYCNLVFYFVGECVKRNNTYLHVLSSWRNQVPGSLPFFSMYARRVLQGSGNTAMCVNKGQPISQTPQCDKGPVNNLNHSIGATWHVPGKKICVSKLPMHKSSIQSCLQL